VWNRKPSVGCQLILYNNHPHRSLQKEGGQLTNSPPGVVGGGQGVGTRGQQIVEWDTTLAIPAIPPSRLSLIIP
jgi:hypothetical protein